MKFTHLTLLANPVVHNIALGYNLKDIYNGRVFPGPPGPRTGTDFFSVPAPIPNQFPFQMGPSLVAGLYFHVKYPRIYSLSMYRSGS